MVVTLLPTFQSTLNGHDYPHRQLNISSNSSRRVSSSALKSNIERGDGKSPMNDVLFKQLIVGASGLWRTHFCPLFFLPHGLFKSPLLPPV